MSTPAKPHIPDSPETQTLGPELMRMVEEFQCPGCLKGGNTQCGAFKTLNHVKCDGHICGTFMPGIGFLALGLPKGYNKPGWREDNQPSSVMRLRLWKRGTNPGWDKLNLAVWALEKDGYLFVRTVMPRIGMVMVDVIEGGTLADVPGALNTAEFESEFD